MVEIKYAGRRVADKTTKKGAVVKGEFVYAHDYEVVTSDNDDFPIGRRMLFLDPIQKFQSIGSVFTTQLQLVGDKFRFGEVKFARVDRANQAQYVALDASAEAVIEAQKIAAKAEDPFIESLKFARDAYRATNYSGKRVLLAKLIEYITR